ncbi:MAG: hypothetical protein MZW92_77230 [Comamonadaceae bacterium]|nr:hypothetical protein [Comamonadaceae bacterium]
MSLPRSVPATRDVAALGQVFTPPEIVDAMLRPAPQRRAACWSRPAATARSRCAFPVASPSSRTGAMRRRTR